MEKAMFCQQNKPLMWFGLQWNACYNIYNYNIILYQSAWPKYKINIKYKTSIFLYVWDKLPDRYRYQIANTISYN